MMNESFGKRFILNGELQTSESFENSMVYEGESVYEVIRMVKGSPVFFQDHMERLTSSVQQQKKKMLADIQTLRRDIINLSKSEKKKEINLKIVFNYNKDSENYLVYYIQSVYPTEEQYRKGVKGILFYAERKDPTSKVIDHKLRSKISQKLLLEGAYEVLLVNENGKITEGSRSNIFFVSNDKLVTAPDDSVLCGITRKHLLEICKENNIKVTFRCLEADNIDHYDAVFMTGTSPMVLPFCCIGKKVFRTNLPVIDDLRKLYISKAEESVNPFR